MRRGCRLLALALLAGCGSDPPSRLAAFRAPEVPPECRAAVYEDPTVRELMRAGAAVPSYRAENQDRLAFAEAEAERRCLREKGLLRSGGVEPIKYLWYPPLF